MVNNPFFSVVIPTYNRRGLILKTLDTVLSQTYKHYEVIVVDDCSSDDTAQLLQPLVDSGKIRFIKNEEHSERAETRNTGMENARGEFLTFLDSDDLMYPTNLEDAAQFIKANPDSKFFHNLYQLVDTKGRVLCKYDFPSLDSPIQAITAGNFLASIGVFMHREIYERYRVDSNSRLVGSEDWDLWLRIMADYTPGRINKVNNGVVHHSRRSIYSMELPQLRDRFAYLTAKIADDPHLNATYGKYLKRLEGGSLLYTGTVANLMGHHGEALKCLLRAAALDIRSAASIRFMKALGIALLRLDKGY